MELLAQIINFLVSHSTDLLGVILPPLVDILNRDVPDEKEKLIVTVLVCTVAAFFTKYNSLAYGDPAAFMSSLGIIFMESQIVFKLYFKNSYVRQKIQERIQGTENPTMGEGGSAVDPVPGK